MSERLSRDEVEQLMETLSRAEPEQSGWQPGFDRLERAFARARAAEANVRRVLSMVWIAIALYLVVRLYLVQWNASGILLELTICALLLNTLRLAAGWGLNALHPVLWRRDRVAALLGYFGADISDDETGQAAPRVPPNVLTALRMLERAKAPTELGRAYATVEKWSRTTQPSLWDDVPKVVLWALALSGALFGDSLGLPDFWRGAAFMFAIVLVVLRVGASQNKAAALQRAEKALGRWRHLVPAMRELPP